MDPEGRGQGYRPLPLKSQVIWVSMENKHFDPPVKSLPPLEIVGTKSFYKMKEFELIIFKNINITDFLFLCLIFISGQ